jgi:hypothetical protein
LSDENVPRCDLENWKTTAWPAVYSRVFNTEHLAKPKSHILIKMTNTGERREITSRANAKEAEIIQQSKELVAKTKRVSAIASTKNLARRKQELDGTPPARKNTP